MEANDIQNVTVENIPPDLFDVGEVGFWNFIEIKNEQNHNWKFIKTRWVWSFDLFDLVDFFDLFDLKNDLKTSGTSNMVQWTLF